MNFSQAFLVLAALAGSAAAQQELRDYRTMPLQASSGLHSGRGTVPLLVFEHTVTVSGAPWMRLGFDRVELGRESYLALFAPRDGGYQLLDGEAFEQWRRTSAVFNGDAIVVQLFAAPGDRDVFFDLAWAQVGQSSAPHGSYETLCGSDSRVASTDNRVGRLFFGGCTAWRVTNGALVTAGHCVDFDPDGTGPNTPDGVPDLFGFVEFDVPSSTTGGATVFASPDDQYAIDGTTLAWRFDGETQGYGKDWGVFGVFPNSNTGLLPHQAYGLPYRVSDVALVSGATVRITGFGKDSTPPGVLGGQNAQTFTNQTSTGPYVGIFTGNIPANLYHEYEADTEEGSSGSPILWASKDLVLGVHTNGGCSPGTFGNAGTALQVTGFFDDLHDFPGSSVEYVDGLHPHRIVATGEITHPWATVAEGVNSSPSGGHVSIVAGTYAETWTATNPVLLDAPSGTVVIR